MMGCWNPSKDWMSSITILSLSRDRSIITEVTMWDKVRMRKKERIKGFE
ncbi:hypothetical protein A2U01_0074738, partial [Trifolium medium]|nr:hypothetical protein [Trifolium medium]